MSPFLSKSQRKWAFATHQPWAKEWESKTKNKKLPEKVGKNGGNTRRSKKTSRKRG